MLQFTESERFMESWLSNLVNSLAEEIQKIKCKNELNNNKKKRCKTCGIKYKDCDCFIDYINFLDNLIEYKCSYFNKNYPKKILMKT